MTQLGVFCAAVSNGSMQSIKSLYNTTRNYGSKGDRLHRPNSSVLVLLHPPQYVPEEAAGLTASDNMSAPSYKIEAPGSHCQITIGEYCTFSDAARLLTVIINSLVLQPAAPTSGPAAVVRARRLKQHRPAVASASSSSLS